MKNKQIAKGLIKASGWAYLIKFLFFLFWGLFWWRQSGWVHSFRFRWNFNELKFWWLCKVIELLFVVVCWIYFPNRTSVISIKVNVYFLFHISVSICSLAAEFLKNNGVYNVTFLGKKNPRGKKWRKSVAQAEVAVIMMLKSLKSGIQDLVEVEKEMQKNLETTLHLLQNQMKVSIIHK